MSGSEGALVSYEEDSVASVDVVARLDAELRRLQTELTSADSRLKNVREMRTLLEQLQTIDAMADGRRAACREVFGDTQCKPSRTLFLEQLPDPDVYTQHAIDRLNEKMGTAEEPEGAQERLHEMTAKRSQGRADELLAEEIQATLSSIGDGPPLAPGCQVRLCRSRGTDKALGCAVVKCGSVADSDRAQRTLLERWTFPDAAGEDVCVLIHFLDESAEPTVTVESSVIGTGEPGSVDKPALRKMLEQYGDVKNIYLRKGSASVEFTRIEDAYVAISALHAKPVTTVCTLEVEGPVAEIAPCLEQMLGREVKVVGQPFALSAAPPRHSVTVDYDGDPADLMHLLQLPDDQHQCTVVNVETPPLLSLRLPRKRQQIGLDERHRVSALESDYKMAQGRMADLVKHRKLLNEQLQKVTEAAHKARSDFEVMQRRTGWDKRKVYQTHTQLDRPNTIAHLMRELTALEEEQRSLKRDGQEKTAAIETLCHRLHKGHEVTSQIQGLEGSLAEMKLEQQEANDEVRTLKRILWQKGKRADALQRQDDTKIVKGLESDKRVLQQEIQRKAKESREKEKTIQAQDHMLCNLDARLSAIAKAVRGWGEKQPLEVDTAEMEKQRKEAEGEGRAGASLPTVYRFRPSGWRQGPEGDTVSGEDYNAMQKLLVQRRDILRLKDRLLLERDAQLEAAQSELDIMEHAWESDKRRRVYLERDAGAILEQMKATRQGNYDYFVEWWRAVDDHAGEATELPTVQARDD